MISLTPLLSSCIIAASLLIRSSDGFSTVASNVNNQWGLTTTQLSSSVVNEFDLATTELASFSKRKSQEQTMLKKQKRAAASPTSSYGKSNVDELTVYKPVGIESEFPSRKIKANVRETGQDSMKYYIKSMCNHDLLNKNEEIILAREIQILLKWEAEREKLEEELLR